MTDTRDFAKQGVSRSAAEVKGPSALVAIHDEPPPRLFVDPPLPQSLARGKVFIQYRTENIRIVAVFGAGAIDVSPRIGHVHITVDELPWHFIDASGETLVLVGLRPGRHTVKIELANPVHHVIASESVHFVVPDDPAELGVDRSDGMFAASRNDDTAKRGPS